MRSLQNFMFRPAISAATFLMLSEVCFAATFQPIAEVPTGFAQTPEAISADGSTVVGSCACTSQNEAFVWTADGGLIGLGDLLGSGSFSQAQGVSADGSVVVGISVSASHSPRNEAFIWTSVGGMVGLGDIPGHIFYSDARGVSADGSVVVGYGYSSNGHEAFRWTAAGGMVGLDDFRGGGHRSEANAISADGNVIVGAGKGNAGIEAFRWTAAEGLVGLGFLYDGPNSESVAEAVSADGSVIVGNSINADGEHRPFRWTATEGMVELGDFAVPARAISVSADGSVIGVSEEIDGVDAAHIWTEAEGMRSLRQTLIEQGADVDGWRLNEATGISDDGTTIAGYGQVWDETTQSWGVAQGFVATINLVTAVVEIDVDPWSPANTVQPDSNDLIHVAVMGSDLITGDATNFDVYQINPDSLKLGVWEAPNISLDPLYDDYDNDNNTDAVFVFDTQDSGILCDDPDVTLRGATFSGLTFEGTDTIVTTDCDTVGCHP